MNKIPPVIIALIGFIVYSTAGILSIYSNYFNYVKLLAVVVILWGFIKSPKKQYQTNLLLAFFTAYTVFVFIRGSLVGNLPVDGGREIGSIYGIIQYFLTYPHSPLVYIVILFLLVPFDKREIRYYRLLGYACTFLCLLNVFLFRNELFIYDSFGVTHILKDGEYLSIRHLITMCFVGLGFVLILAYGQKSFKLPNWFTYLPILIILLYALAQVAGGGRGGSVTALVYIIFLVYFLLKSNDQTSVFRFIFKWGVIVFVVYGVYYVLFKSNITDFLFSRLFEGGEMSGELKESTREGFVDFLIRDLDNHPLAWLIGKGCNGSYPLGDGTLRGAIEWGYMFLILKGGIIYLVLYVSVLLRSFYLGFFKSNNNLSKAMAVLCLVCAYQLIPFGLPEVSIGFVLVWRYVRFINTREMRMMTDTEIKALS